MTPALLDTSLVIALFQEGRAFELEGFSSLALSSVTYAELRLGVAMATTADVARRRMAALEQARELFGSGIPFDDEAANRFGLIAAEVQRTGGDPKAHRTDRMIAAIAASTGRTLLTLNEADLRGLDALVAVGRPDSVGAPE